MSEEVKDTSTSLKLEKLDSDEFDTFFKDAIHLAFLRGFLVLDSYSPHKATTINMSLEPVAKSEKWMDMAYKMATEIGEILRNMQRKEEYVTKVMQQMSTDPYLKSLLELKEYAKEN